MNFFALMISVFMRDYYKKIIFFINIFFDVTAAFISELTCDFLPDRFLSHDHMPRLSVVSFTRVLSPFNHLRNS